MSQNFGFQARIFVFELNGKRLPRGVAWGYSGLQSASDLAGAEPRGQMRRINLVCTANPDGLQLALANPKAAGLPGHAKNTDGFRRGDVGLASGELLDDGEL
jgi:hypothetical protein